MLQQGNDADVIPLLGTLALGAQRLLPALQQIYSGWAALKSRTAPIQAVLNMLDQPLPPLIRGVDPFPMRQSIRLEGVNFSYNSNEQQV